ncbi:MAG TPA: magnesium protoporphyrin IX methyltransferase [Roseococcus sp.]|nr:magnesium protoporphyrin IX methyltransferase [Roseococcus sp.]
MPSYATRRSELETYFDRTASATWARLTSDAPVSGIRATVRAGRDQVCEALLSWLPEDMTGLRLLDAGCGTGALATLAAARGAEVLAVDLSAKLVECARDRAAVSPGRQPQFLVGDMLAPEHGEFDHLVAMDSLIHYEAADIVAALAGAAPRIRRSMIFTVAPRTHLLAAMHAVGRFFPRGDRAPAIEPLAEAKLRALVAAEPALAGFEPGRHHRVTTGFYMSHAFEWVRR